MHLNFACSKHPVTFHKSCWNGYINWLLMKAFLLRHVFVLVCYWRGLVIVLQAGLDVFNWNAHFQHSDIWLSYLSCPMRISLPQEIISHISWPVKWKLFQKQLLLSAGNAFVKFVVEMTIIIMTCAVAIYRILLWLFSESWLFRALFFWIVLV